MATASAKPDVLFSGGDGPIDLRVQQAAIARRQALAQAMIKEGMQPLATGQEVQGHFVPVNPLQGLAQVLKSYWGREDENKANTDQTALGDKYNAGLKTAMQDYFDHRNGKAAIDPTSEQYGPIAPGQGPASLAATPGSPAIPANPQSAAVGAITSQYAPLRAVGTSDLTSLNKNHFGAADIAKLPGYTAASRGAAMNAIENGLPPAVAMGMLQADPKYIVADGRVLDNNNVTGGPVQDFSKKFDAPKPMAGIEGGLVQTEKNSGEAKVLKGVNPPSTMSVTNKMDMVDHTAGIKGLVEDAKTSKTGAQGVPGALQHISESLGLLSQGAMHGQLTDQKLLAAKVAGAFGLPVDPKIAPTEQLKQILGQTVIDALPGQSPGGKTTDADVKLLTGVNPNQLMEAPTLRRALAISAGSLLNKVDNHNKLVENGLTASDEKAYQVQFKNQIINHLGGNDLTGDPVFKKMVANVQAGKSSVDGLTQAEIDSPFAHSGIKGGSSAATAKPAPLQDAIAAELAKRGH